MEQSEYGDRLWHNVSNRPVEPGVPPQQAVALFVCIAVAVYCVDSVSQLLYVLVAASASASFCVCALRVCVAPSSGARPFVRQSTPHTHSHFSHTYKSLLPDR